MRAFSIFAAASSLALASLATAMDRDPATADVEAAAAQAAEMAADEADIAASVADPARNAENVQLDAGRRPVETLAFLGLRPGMDAVDIFTGSGYWAEIMSRVVAPDGSVVAYEPSQFYNGKGKETLDALIAASPSARVDSFPFEAFTAPANAFDFAMINLNYHDVYWVSERFKIGRQEPDTFTRNLFAAMRPGGVVGVIDHVGPAGDTRAIVQTTHRIDPAVVKADFERAGFVLESESDLLANPADDHTVNVFDAAVRGKTDRFLFKFRKPA